MHTDKIVPVKRLSLSKMENDKRLRLVVEVQDDREEEKK